MSIDLAITRGVARSIARCELTFLERASIDHERAHAQHSAYCEHFERLGVKVVRLAADEEQPDCCFVEDTAVVLDELAIITQLASPSRRLETTAIVAELGKHRRLEHMQGPATIEGGDVLVVGRRIFVGRTTRTNELGIAALRDIVGRYGYDVVAVGVLGCLHLKSAVTALDDDTLLVNRALLDPRDLETLAAFRLIDVDPAEPSAANVLCVRGEVWAHAGYPRTLERLARAGVHVVPIDISEIVKAEGALTCTSLLLRKNVGGKPGQAPAS